MLTNADPMHSAAQSDASHRELHDEALQVLSVAHYVLAALTIAMTPVGIYLVWVGWDLLHPARGEAWTPRAGQEFLDPVRWGATLYFTGGVLASLSVIHAGLLAYIGRCIARRTRRRLCLAFSVFDMTYVPLGTALGVCTLVLLLKDPVKSQFAKVRSAECGVRSAHQ